MKFWSKGNVERIYLNDGSFLECKVSHNYKYDDTSTYNFAVEEVLKKDEIAKLNLAEYTNIENELTPCGIFVACKENCTKGVSLKNAFKL